MNVAVTVFVVAGLLMLSTVVALFPKLLCLFISSTTIILAEVLVLFVSIFIDKVYVVPALKFRFVFVNKSLPLEAFNSILFSSVFFSIVRAELVDISILLNTTKLLFLLTTSTL